MRGGPQKRCSGWNRAKKSHVFSPQAAWGRQARPNGKSGRQMPAACGGQYGYLGVPECPLLALSGHSSGPPKCPLVGVKRTSLTHAPMSAFDPKRTLRARHWTAPFSNSKAATLRGECHQRVTPKRLRPSFASWCAVTIGWWHGWRRSARGRKFKIFAKVLLLAQKRSSAG